MPVTPVVPDAQKKGGSSGASACFLKVIAMIDEMVTLLKAEQGEDSSKKAYCIRSFDETGDEAVQKSISEPDASVAKATEN